MLMLLPLGAGAADNVTITISPVAPARGVLRAGSDPATSLATVLGETVTLTVTAGREYTLEGVGGLGGLHVNTTPTDGDVIRITAQAGDDDDYLLRIRASRWRGGRVRLVSTTVAADAGEWVRLWGEESPNSRQVIRFSAGGQPNAFYVMIRP